MPHFSYKAVNAGGATISGTIEADTADSAADALFTRGYVPAKITTQKAASESSWRNRLRRLATRVPKTDLILFTKQFRSMLHAGVPLMRLLQVLEAQTKNTALKQAIGDMTRSVKEGSTCMPRWKRTTISSRPSTAAWWAPERPAAACPKSWNG